MKLSIILSDEDKNIITPVVIDTNQTDINKETIWNIISDMMDSMHEKKKSL